MLGLRMGGGGGPDDFCARGRAWPGDGPPATDAGAAFGALAEREAGCGGGFGDSVKAPPRAPASMPPQAPSHVPNTTRKSATLAIAWIGSA